MKHEIGFKGRMLARSEDDGDGRTIEGVAVPFGDVIDVWGERETFDPDTVFEGLDSAKLYYQHDTLIGSITSGENREDGLHITARIADTQQGRDAVALLDEGALDSLSVGFVPIEDRKDKDGVTHRRKVRLLETSLVSWPAYENAKLTNHRNNNQEETPMTEQAEKWTEALAKLTNRQDEQAEILRGIETTLTSRLNQQRGTSPLGEYHSQGELLKALVSDDTGKAKLIIKQQAYESGCHASFMPKPLAGEDGSAMFLCQSLFDHDGNNVFWGEDDEKYHLSDIAKHYMAGILAHAREISAITNPTVNSYKRITTGGDSVPLRKRLIRLPSSRRRFLFRNCIWCNPYSSGSQLPRPGGGVILRSTHSHHERRNKFQKCQISSPVTDASKNQGR